MIDKLHLESFKCFSQADFTLRKLNLFVGCNGAGKSSVLQSLLAVRQSFESHLLQSHRLQLNGRLVQLGSFDEIFCVNSPTNFLNITLKYDNSNTLNLKVKRDPDHKLLVTIPVEQNYSLDGHLDLNLFRDCFNYLQAERLGPRKVYELSPDQMNPFDVGTQGEHGPVTLAAAANGLAVGNSALTLEAGTGETIPTLTYQWPLWMRRIFPGFDSQSESIARTDQVRLSFALGQIEGTGARFYTRPPNTGFGLSYVMGPLLAGLIAQPKSVLIVENPEAHLHPKAQSMLGEFLARVSLGGVQVFIETHSEHLLNGIRRVVKQGIVEPDDVTIHYFARDDDGFSVYDRILIDKDAKLSSWPSGFFDQLDKDLLEIYSVDDPTIPE